MHSPAAIGEVVGYEASGHAHVKLKDDMDVETLRLGSCVAVEGAVVPT